MAKTQNGSDGRVPCPLCREPIHPLAGRCKHCRADISTARSVAVEAVEIPERARRARWMLPTLAASIVAATVSIAAFVSMSS